MILLSATGTNSAVFRAIFVLLTYRGGRQGQNHPDPSCCTDQHAPGSFSPALPILSVFLYIFHTSPRTPFVERVSARATCASVPPISDSPIAPLTDDPNPQPWTQYLPGWIPLLQLRRSTMRPVRPAATQGCTTLMSSTTCVHLCCDSMVRGANGSLAGRYRLDDHFNSLGSTDDSRSRVSLADHILEDYSVY